MTSGQETSRIARARWTWSPLTNVLRGCARAGFTDLNAVYGNTLVIYLTLCLLCPVVLGTHIARAQSTRQGQIHNKSVYIYCKNMRAEGDTEHCAKRAELGLTDCEGAHLCIYVAGGHSAQQQPRLCARVYWSKYNLHRLFLGLMCVCERVCPSYPSLLLGAAVVSRCLLPLACRICRFGVLGCPLC